MAQVQQAERPAGHELATRPQSDREAKRTAAIERRRRERDLTTQRVVSAKVSTRTRLGEIWQGRELLGFLVRKELQIRYKNSFLGFLWSFLNPAMVLLIYFVMFRYILNNGIPDFAVYLFCGLLPWNLFNNSLLSASGTLVAHSGIVKKVAFPREILALAQVGVACCYFFFQTCILVIFLVGFHVMPAWEYLPIALFSLVCVTVLSAALSLLLSALNVYMRDIEHLIQVLLVALFFCEPIVYEFSDVSEHLVRHHLMWMYLANPLTSIVLGFQRFIFGNVPGALPPVPKGSTPYLATYGGVAYAELLGAVLVGSLILCYLALLVFRRVEGNFAEEL